MDRAQLIAIGKQALSKGATIPRERVVDWQCAGDCLAPLTVTKTGRDLKRGRAIIMAEVKPHLGWEAGFKPAWAVARHSRGQVLWLDITVRCRRCRNCLRYKSRMWTERACVEIAQSARTWFGTLTWSPHNHYTAYCRAWQTAKSRAVDLTQLSPSERFARLVHAHGPEVQRYLKRVRKNSHTLIRYLSVWEQHKSGYPHVHMLLHEVHKSEPVRHRVLTDAWTGGFSKWKLCRLDESAAAAKYVAKYLTKSGTVARVRASVLYGHALEQKASEAPRALTPKDQHISGR